jgi:hypothetical protein
MQLAQFFSDKRQLARAKAEAKAKATVFVKYYYVI